MLTFKKIESKVRLIKACRQWGIVYPDDERTLEGPTRIMEGFPYHSARDSLTRIRAGMGARLILERRGYELDTFDAYELEHLAHSMTKTGNWRDLSHDVATRWEDRNDC